MNQQPIQNELHLQDPNILNSQLLNSSQILILSSNKLYIDNNNKSKSISREKMRIEIEMKEEVSFRKPRKEI